MKAAVIHRFGQPPRFEEFPDPTPGADEVLVQVRAAGLHPVVKALASGSHYGSRDQLPLMPAIDAVGRLEDGRRVYLGNPRPPYGTMAEQTVVPRSMCIPLPEGLDDAAWAALLNPGMSAWLALTWRARLAPGETVLVLGATGVAGQLAVELAKRLGAGRVLAAGRDQQVLATLPDLGADQTVSLDQPDQDLPAAFAAAVAEDAVDVVIDYLWGRPTEALIAAVSRRGLTHHHPARPGAAQFRAGAVRERRRHHPAGGHHGGPARVHRPRGRRRAPDGHRAAAPGRGCRRLAARSARPQARPPPIGQMLRPPTGWSAVERCQDLVGVVDPSTRLAAAVPAITEPADRRHQLRDGWRSGPGAELGVPGLTGIYELAMPVARLQASVTRSGLGNPVALGRQLRWWPTSLQPEMGLLPGTRL